MDRYPRLLQFILFCTAASVLVGGDGDGDGDGDGAGETGCDPDFKSQVEGCLKNLDGFPSLTHGRTLLVGDWAMTDVICDWKVVLVASACVKGVYTACPKTKVLRSLCGFQGLDPDLLTQFGQSICKHREVLQQQSECLNSSMCSVNSCLSKYDYFVPSRVSVGTLKLPLFSHQCSYQAYVEFCYKNSLTTGCPTSLLDAHMDILNVTRPPQCSQLEIDQYQMHFEQLETDVILNGASINVHCSVTNLMIGVSMLIVAGSDIFGIG